MNKNVNIYSFNDECYVYLGDYNKLQQENKQLKERIKYLERSNNRREDTILEQRQEINDLGDNWDKLKEYMKKTKLKEFEKSYGKRYGKTFTQAEVIVCNMILNKMQELQGSVKDSKKCDSLQQRIDKALNKIDNMFNKGDENSIIDDLLELDKILKGSDSNEI